MQMQMGIQMSPVLYKTLLTVCISEKCCTFCVLQSTSCFLLTVLITGTNKSMFWPLVQFVALCIVLDPDCCLGWRQQDRVCIKIQNTFSNYHTWKPANFKLASTKLSVPRFVDRKTACKSALHKFDCSHTLSSCNVQLHFHLDNLSFSSRRCQLSVITTHFHGARKYDIHPHFHKWQALPPTPSMNVHFTANKPTSLHT